MEAKESLVIVLRALLEIHEPVSRQALMDFLTGKQTDFLKEKEFCTLDTFGTGSEQEEEYWLNIVKAACEQGFLKVKSVKNDTLVPTATGKKFLKKPASFQINTDGAKMESFDVKGEFDDIVNITRQDKAIADHIHSERTRQQIKLIRAIDRHVALDDYAENESLAFDDVLADLESLVKQGKKIDISYFTDEVLGGDCVEELVDFFKTEGNDSLSVAIKEFGDVYSEEEIRLVRIVYRSRNAS